MKMSKKLNRKRNSNTRYCVKCGQLLNTNHFGTYTKNSKTYFRSSCRPCLREYDRERDKANPERVSDKNRKYYLANLTQERKRCLDYHKKHPERLRQQAKRFRDTNPDKVKFWNRRWVQNNPERVKANSNNRRARLKAVGGKISHIEWERLCESFGYKCLSCGKDNIKLTIDHVVPISLGGVNLINNAQPLCKSCNSSKGTKIMDFR